MACPLFPAPYLPHLPTGTLFLRESLSSCAKLITQSMCGNNRMSFLASLGMTLGLCEIFNAQVLKEKWLDLMPAFLGSPDE